jgi:hypothetical protein
MAGVGTSLGRTTRFALRWSVVIAITFAGLEAGFRLFPELIPDDLLQRFQNDLRTEIAVRRYLPNETQTWALERDDGGPPIKLFHPHALVKYHYLDTGERGDMVMDSQGFCNAPELTYDPPTIELITLGDSFTVCHPPNPALTWPSVLARLSGLQTYSLARGGYGPYEYLQILKRFGLSKQPDVVVMQVYEGNDLRDAARYHDFVAASDEEKVIFADRRGWELTGTNYHPFLQNALGRHSYAYNMLVAGSAVGMFYGKQQLSAWLSRDGAQRVNFRYRLRFPDAVVDMNVDNRDKDEVRTARDLRDGRLSLTAFDQALRTFAALASEHGFRAIVTYAPSTYSAYAEFVEFEDPALAELMPWFNRVQTDYLSAKAEELGLEFLDLTPSIKARARDLMHGELLYFPNNVHFTPAAHETVARAVAEALEAAPGGLLVEPSAQAPVVTSD